MGYIISQIFFCLLAATMIGVIIGWLLRRVSCKKHEQALNNKWAQRLHRAKQARDTA